METKSFLTESDITLFYKQGYLLKPQALSDEEIDRLQKIVTATIDRALQDIDQSPDPIFSNEDQVHHIDGSIDDSYP